MNIKNMRRLIRRMQRIKPEKYRQDTWNCGTAMCLAGHAAVLAGARPLKEWGMAMFKKKKVGVPDVAEKWLGIDRYYSDYDVFTAVPECSWPYPFAEQWAQTGNRNTARTRARRRDIAVAYLKHLVAEELKARESAGARQKETTSGATR